MAWQDKCLPNKHIIYVKYVFDKGTSWLFLASFPVLATPKFMVNIILGLWLPVKYILNVPSYEGVVNKKNFSKQWLAGVQELHFQGLHCLRSKAQKEDKHSLFSCNTKSPHWNWATVLTNKHHQIKWLLPPFSTPLTVLFLNHRTTLLTWPDPHYALSRESKSMPFDLITFWIEFLKIYQSLYIQVLLFSDLNVPPMVPVDS